MAPPPAKKPKTDPKAPIISKSPGFKPDIYFKVFDQESHVTSMVLKLTSGFFRTFLDPTGGELSKSTKPAFTSEWFTKVDDDGSWALSSDHKFRDMDLSNFKGGKEYEEHTFEKFLCALFNRQYQLRDAAEPATLTEFARYYQALPALSETVYVAALKCPGFSLAIMKDPCSVLVSSKTLRNDLLFKDSFLLCLGRWSEPAWFNLRGDLQDLASAAYAEISTAIVDVQESLLIIIGNNRPKADRYTGKIPTTYEDPAKVLGDAAGDCVSTNRDKKGTAAHKFILPKYYRKCSEITKTSFATSIREAVQSLLGNKLKLDPSAKPGAGLFEDYFPWYEFDDEILPWDRTQEEWHR